MKKEQVKGRITQAKGKIKEAVGKVFGNHDLEQDGNSQKIIGKVQAGVGDYQEDVKHASLQSLGSNGRGSDWYRGHMKVDAGVSHPINPHRRIKRVYSLNPYLFAIAPTEFSLGCIVFIE